MAQVSRFVGLSGTGGQLLPDWPVDGGYPDSSNHAL
jgi:hypothetical protein